MKQKILSGAALLLIVATLTYCGKDDDNSTTTTPEVVKEMTIDEVETDFSNELASNEIISEFAVLNDEIPEIPENFVKDLIKAGKQNPAQKSSSNRPCDKYYVLNTSTTKVLSFPAICEINPKVTIDLSTGDVYGCYDFPTGGGCTKNDKKIENSLAFKIGTDGKLTYIFDQFKYGDYILSGEMSLSRNWASTVLKNLTIEIPGKYKLTRDVNITQKFLPDGLNEISMDSKTLFTDGGTNSIKTIKTILSRGGCNDTTLGDGRAVAVFGKAVAGTIEMRIRGNVSTVDFGDETCAAKWILTKDGKSKQMNGEIK
jgi:hypothetical protein